MAAEMFLKCYLAHFTGLTEEVARKQIGHDLDEALTRCLAHDTQSDLGVLRGQLGAFPAISDRYNTQKRPLKELWFAYSLAQVAGSCLIRSVTDRDVRQTLKAT